MNDPINDIVAVVPIRDFAGMTRLATVLTGDQRRRLSERLAAGVLDATIEAGLRPLVVTSSKVVWRWAVSRSIPTCDDSGDGLSAAAATGIACGGDRPWIVLHADLPLATASAIRSIADASQHSAVIVPSQDGGTSVLSGYGRFPFAYGPGSFHRHLASVPTARVMVLPALSIDIDTPDHLEALPRLV
ncbi:MAG: NTP transferase domain-containing protein [Actinomycetia bacterium]|nr:NTP transferase domain-containing protein [Actinomycetes bacterium]